MCLGLLLYQNRESSPKHRAREHAAGFEAAFGEKYWRIGPRLYPMDTRALVWLPTFLGSCTLLRLPVSWMFRDPHLVGDPQTSRGGWKDRHG